MPLNGFKSVTVSPDTYETARKLVENGVGKNIGQVIANAVKKYALEKSDMINEMEAVKAKYTDKC